MRKKKTNKHVHNPAEFIFTALMVVFTMVIISGVFSYITTYSPGQQLAVNQPPKMESHGQIAPVPTEKVKGIIKVPFNYTVTEVTDANITLNAESGNLLLPNDAEAVKVYNGMPPLATDSSIANLAVGNIIHLRLIPGENAWLYVLGIK